MDHARGDLGAERVGKQGPEGIDRLSIAPKAVSRIYRPGVNIGVPSLLHRGSLYYRDLGIFLRHSLFWAVRLQNARDIVIFVERWTFVDAAGGSMYRWRGCRVSFW